MNFALLISDLPTVYHVQEEQHAPVAQVKPSFVASIVKRMRANLVTRLQRN